MKAILAAALLMGVSGLALSASAAPPAPAPGAPAAQPPQGPPGGPGRHVRFDPDTNHDGFLSRDEALAAADQRFKRLDSNNDGKLTKEDFAHRGPPGGPWARGAPGQGGAGDQGGPPPPQAGAPTDGPPGEGWRDRRGGPWMAMMMQGRRMMEQRREHAMDARLEHLLAEYDRNKDGAIEPAEFRAQALAQFNAQDGNHDHKVKLPEHKGPPDGMMGGRGGPGRWGPPRDGQGPQGAPPPPNQ